MRHDFREFLAYAIPATVGMIVAGSFGVVDTVFVGQATGKIGLAGVWLAYPASRFLLLVPLVWCWRKG